VKTIILTHQASEAAQELIRKAMETCAPSLTEAPIHNIPQARAEKVIKAGTTVVAFGKWAERAARQHIEEKSLQDVRVVALAAPHKLEARPSNQEDRERTATELRSLEELARSDSFQPQVRTVNTEDLPDLDARQIAMLQKMTEEEGKISCLQVAKNGKLVSIGAHQEGADANVTWEELLFVRMAMDTLGTQEVTLVPADQDPSAQNF
jgi:predicted kinase